MNELEGMISGLLSNPDEMKKIMEMAGAMFGGDKSAPETPTAAQTSEMPSMESIMSGLSNLPDGVASMAQKLMGGVMNTSGDKTALLEAMKPWLSEKRKAKLDRAMKLAKVMHLAGAAFLKKGG
ncbi:MAG: hypothetical protein RR147_01785 [Oscillospiraceae bacterium]